MSNSFPYNQSISVISPTSGPCSGYTFIVAASGEGIGACEINKKTTAKGASTYSFGCPYNIDASGQSNSAFAFLVNATNQSYPPYHFLLGSTSGNIYLYSLTPTTNPSDFSVSNISRIGGGLHNFPHPITNISYDPFVPLGKPNVFVADSHANLYYCTLSLYNGGLTCGGWVLTLYNGNLMLIDPVGKTRWETNTTTGVVAVMQTDGNFVLYNTAVASEQSYETALWSTGTNGNTSNFLNLDENGNLSIFGNGTDFLIYNSGACSSTSAQLKSGKQIQPSIPSFTYGGCESQYEPASNGQIQILPIYLENQLSFFYVTGLTGGGLLQYFVPGTSGTTAFIPNAPMNTVAVAVGIGGTYVATANALYLADHITGAFHQIWTTSTQTITSLAFSNFSDPSIGFSNGALFIGAFTTANGSTNGSGSVWVYNPAAQTSTILNPFPLAGNDIAGNVYSLYADNSGHVLSNNGSTGLTFFNLVTNNNCPTQSYALIPNVVPASSEHVAWFSMIVSLCDLAIGVVTLEPIPFILGVAGIVSALPPEQASIQASSGSSSG